MRNFFKIVSIIILLSLTVVNFSFADNPHYVDFSKVLNQSKAGKEAQDYLKAKFESESKKFSQEEKKLRKEEADIISKKTSERGMIASDLLIEIPNILSEYEL